jgi:hypothetical protein
MLSATRRRPRGDRTVEDIIVILHSLYDGYYLRHALDPERFPLDLVVDALWDLTVMWTEPGFLASDEGSSPLRDDLIWATLQVVRDGNTMPDLLQVARAAHQDPQAVSAEFGDGGSLAEACLERLCSQAIELRALADQTKGMASWTLRGFLGWLESLVDEYGPLVRAANDAKVWSELTALIDMLILTVADSLNPSKRNEIARKLIDAVRSGSDWEPALSVPHPPAMRLVLTVTHTHRSGAIAGSYWRSCAYSITRVTTSSLALLIDPESKLGCGSYSIIS